MTNSPSATIEVPPRPESLASRLISSSALRHKTFRWLWVGGVASFLGTWTHNVAARWTAATVSGSPLAVTSVDTLQLLPVVFLSLFAGVLADSLDRRKLLITTHLVLTVVTLSMGVLALTGRLGLPSLLILTAMIGTLGALNGPAWQATVPRQVPEDEVPNAVALISTGFNIARMLGPTIGAWMLLSFGVGAAFLANAASYLMIGILMYRLPPQPRKLREKTSVSPLLDRSLHRPYVVVFLFALFAMPSLALLPLIARDTLHGNALTYGTLLSAFGIGAVCAGPFIAAGSRKLGFNFFVSLTCLSSAVGLALITLPEVSVLALLGAVLCGIGWIGTISTANATVNTRSRPEVRGRAMAFYLTFAMGGQALGSFIAGWGAQHFGVMQVLRICMLLLMTLAVGIMSDAARTANKILILVWSIATDKGRALVQTLVPPVNQVDLVPVEIESFPNPPEHSGGGNRERTNDPCI